MVQVHWHSKLFELLSHATRIRLNEKDQKHVLGVCLDHQRKKSVLLHTRRDTISRTSHRVRYVSR